MTSTDVSVRESHAGQTLWARIIPIEQPAQIVVFTKDCDNADVSFYAFAHEDMSFALELLDQAFRVIRKFRAAEAKQPKPTDHAQRCGIECAKPAFQRFLCEMHGMEKQDEESAKSRIHSMFKIKSRRELNTNEAAAAGWVKLLGEFIRWMKSP